jgi:DNA-binding winged helix-turn-helix (wHTH) protein/TolB-like protein
MNPTSRANNWHSLPIYLFDQFQLDLQNERLLLDGVPVTLQRKAFETLTLLVRNSGRIITKEEFLQELWPDSFVEEGSLTVNISLLRKALGEGRDGRKYIETVPRRGYRFIANVKEVNIAEAALADEESAVTTGIDNFAKNSTLDPYRNGATWIDKESEPTDGTSSAVAGATIEKRRTPLLNPHLSRLRLNGVYAVLILLSLIALAGWFGYSRIRESRSAGKIPRRLAVLPLINLKPDGETDFLSFSLADAITSRLGNLRDLSVQASSSVYKYSNQYPEPQQVARELNVDMILTGSYLKEADELRVSSQMVDGKTGRILWQNNFDLKYDSLLKLQEDVEQQVTSEMGISMAGGKAALNRHDVSHSPLAYEYFLRGIDHYSAARFPLAIEFFEKSVALDPAFAGAWEYLGSAYAVSASMRFGGREHYEKAQAAYERAIALNPERPRSLALQADLLIETNRVELAVVQLRELIRKYPEYPLAYWELSYAYRYAGMLEESIATSKRMLEVHPGYDLRNAVFSSYLYLGQYAKFKATIPVHTESAYLTFYRGFASYHEGDLHKAMEDFDRAYSLDPSLMQAQVGKSLSYGLAGQRLEGLRLLREADRRSEESGVSDAEGIYKIAQAYSVLNDQASALRCLRRSIEGGFFCYPYISRDPLLKAIHGASHFDELLGQARQRHEQFRSKFF